MTKNQFGEVKQCQICSSEDLKTIIDLGHQPPVHAHLNSENLDKTEKKFPLVLLQCQNCKLAQLNYVVDPEVLFPPDYPYLTGLTNMLIRNFQELADSLEKNYSLTKDDLIIDIGSNDGSLLQGFKNKGMKVLGIEPTDTAKVAEKNGIPTLQEYFDKDIAQQILDKHGSAKVVTATNVFAHIHSPHELVENIKQIMTDDGVFVSESQYLIDVIEKTELDTIYHEHLRYYALKPMIEMFKQADMTVVDAERITAAGGSIRVYALKGKQEVSPRVQEIINYEEKIGVYDGSALEGFAKKVKQAKNDLTTLLKKIKDGGGTIVGIGAPARSNTMLNYMGIDKNILDYAVEKKGSPKIGLFTPGTHIPIVDEEKLFTDQPEYALMLSWHIGEELIKKLKELGYNGKFIIPLPEPKII